MDLQAEHPLKMSMEALAMRKAALEKELRYINSLYLDLSGHRSDCGLRALQGHGGTRSAPTFRMPVRGEEVRAYLMWTDSRNPNRNHGHPRPQDTVEA